jgi:small neutral amino acid transporter SnatA (MarC family)
MSVEPAAAEARRRKAANRRTAFALASIAAVFFAGIIATRFIGEPTTGIGIMGGAVLLFLVFAIGRNLISRR